MTSTAAVDARHAADLRGLNQLAIDAVTATTDLVEAMHAAVTHLPAAIGRRAPARASGLTGWIYARIRGATRQVGSGVDASLSLLAPLLGNHDHGNEREAVLAAMNGVVGDHLEASSNPLAITMGFRHAGRDLALTRKALSAALPEANGRIVVLLHGLCMNDRQWRHHDHDHGEALARDLEMMPVYLRYNSGRHISQNGRDFADAMQRLQRAWPVPVERIVLLCHSMGGLVARSACHHAVEVGQPWLQSVSDVVFLGTPHHGAPLERAGSWIDRLIGISPYSAPFARLGRLRSAGIQDLRHGSLRDEDWQATGNEHGDPRVLLPLPKHARCHAIAASTQADDAKANRAGLRGDGLVPIASALGQHADRAFDLRIPKARQWIATGTHHLGLLGSEAVYRRIRTSLQGRVRAPVKDAGPR
ncbi:MAG: GPI inositol-deacylase [Luteimonas sp.]|nr:GPI inositol-deacylase [Luteimonas sp.]